MVFDTYLLNTQHYKVRIKSEVEQSREKSSAPQHFGVLAIEKGAFKLPSTMGINFLLILKISDNQEGIKYQQEAAKPWSFSLIRQWNQKASSRDKSKTGSL